MTIGFFDSGIGGITVLYEAIKLLPHEDYIYYADTLNAPYGVKPKEEVNKYVLDAVEFIVKQGVEAVVVACNTATSISIVELRNRYRIPIIGMEPAVKPAVEKSSALNKRVLVTATPLTIKEEKLKNLIMKVDNEAIVDLLPLPGLVEFAESFNFDEQEVMKYLKQELSSFDLEHYGTIVLGCTHFPLYKNIFKKLVPGDVDIIDGSIGTVKNLKRILEDIGSIKNQGHGEIIYYISGHRIVEREKLLDYDKLFERLANIDN